MKEKIILTELDNTKKSDKQDWNKYCSGKVQKSAWGPTALTPARDTKEKSNNNSISSPSYNIKT